MDAESDYKSMMLRLGRVKAGRTARLHSEDC